jgi:hypothetical protein
MARPLEFALKALIILLILGIAAVQAFVLPLWAYGIAWVADDSRFTWAPTAVLVVAILILLTGQVGLACVWPLLTKVRKGTVFSVSSFAWVNAIIASAFAAAGLSAAVIVFLDRTQLGTPIVGIGLLAAILGGVALALLLIVMRALLKQAAEQHAELAQVI